MSSRIVGDRKLIMKLQSLKDLSFLRPVLKSNIAHVENVAETYPPETAANFPNDEGKWYERGYGNRWLRRGGGVGGSPTSEQLGDNWRSRVESNTRARTDNPTSYGPYVMGSKQAGPLARIGWKTTDTIAAEESKRVLADIKKAVDRKLAT